MLRMRRAIARELMDDTVDAPEELEGSLADIELANAWLGGRAPVVRELERIGAETVLDVGTGSADIPLALVRRAERRGRRLTVTCLDRSEQMLAIARRRTGAPGALRFVRADGAALPYPDGAFDVAMCNLALHHFDGDAAGALLRELRRVSRRSPLVCDLRRSPLAYCGVLAFSRVVSANRLTRHDGPLSVRRAYTPREARALARAAGWRAPRVRRYPFFRMALTDG